MAFDPERLPEVESALTEIHRTESLADRACRNDEFDVWMDESSLAPWLYAEARATLRHLALSVAFQRIQFMARRCASMGVTLEGYDDAGSWIEAKLSKLPSRVSKGEADE